MIHIQYEIFDHIQKVIIDRIRFKKRKEKEIISLKFSTYVNIIFTLFKFFLFSEIFIKFISPLIVSMLGNGNHDSNTMTFLCPKCGDICAHVESLVCKF